MAGYALAVDASALVVEIELASVAVVASLT
jgi:hypothetical protein